MNPALVDIQRHLALNTTAARDLDCPRAQVVAYFARGTRDHVPLAEGCGRRATYLPGPDFNDDSVNTTFVLSATVSIPSRAP